jgi:trehalose utilization protein
MGQKIRVTVWGENVHEKKHPDIVGKLYPRGMHETIAEGLRESPDFEVRTSTLHQPELVEGSASFKLSSPPRA